MESKQKRERTLKDFVDILLPKLWIIVIVAIVAAAVAFVYSYTRQDTYTSQARYLVKYSTEKDTGNSLYNNEIVQNKITNYAVLVDGSEFRMKVVERAKDDYGIDITESQFKNMFSFSASSDAPTFTIRVTHTDANTAFVLANIVEDCIRIEITDMEKNDGLVTEVDAPSQPVVPNSKNEVRNAIIAFLAGMLVSAALILIIVLSDVTIRDKKKLEDNFEIPILGVIPFHDVGNTQGYGSYGGYKR